MVEVLDILLFFVCQNEKICKICLDFSLCCLEVKVFATLQYRKQLRTNLRKTNLVD